MKVIILDTDPIRIEAFLKAFQDKGHTLEVARTQAHGQRIWTPPYDLILLHDELGYAGANPGYDFALMMPQGHKHPVTGLLQQVIVTSWNQDRQRPIVKLLHEKGYSAAWTPYSRTLIDFLEQLSDRKAVIHKP